MQSHLIFSWCLQRYSETLVTPAQRVARCIIEENVEYAGMRIHYTRCVPGNLWKRTCPSHTICVQDFSTFVTLCRSGFTGFNQPKISLILWWPSRSPSVLCPPAGPVARHAGWTGGNLLTQSARCVVYSAPRERPYDGIDQRCWRSSGGRRWIGPVDDLIKIKRR